MMTLKARPGFSRGLRRLSAWLAVALTLVTLPASAHGATITGISDPHFDDWSPVAREVFSSLSEVPGFQSHTRFITPWNVALQPPTSLARSRLFEWMAAQPDQSRVLISFGEPIGCNATNYCPLPHPDQYQQAVAAFRTMYPGVTQFTAWNEPNFGAHGKPNGVGAGTGYLDSDGQIRTNGAQAAADYFSGFERCAVSHAQWPPVTLPIPLARIWLPMRRNTKRD